MLQLNEKHIEEGSDHKHLGEIITKYHSDHVKHRHTVANKPKNNPTKFFYSKNQQPNNH